jgi:TolA-binding protein
MGGGAIIMAVANHFLNKRKYLSDVNKAREDTNVIAIKSLQDQIKFLRDQIDELQKEIRNLQTENNQLRNTIRCNEQRIDSLLGYMRKKGIEMPAPVITINEQADDQTKD